MIFDKLSFNELTTALHFFTLAGSVEAARAVNFGIASSYAGNDTRSNPRNTNVSGSTYPSAATSPAPLTDIPN